MKINRIVLATKWLFGGWVSAAKYLLTVGNKWVQETQDPVKINKILKSLLLSLNFYKDMYELWGSKDECYAVASDYTMQCVSDAIQALEDHKIEWEEFQLIYADLCVSIDAWRSAISLKKRERLFNKRRVA